MLLCYKIKFPENFFLLRGNHEAAAINRIYGFYDECKKRYSIKLWKQFNDLFNHLPFSGADRAHLPHTIAWDPLPPPGRHNSHVYKLEPGINHRAAPLSYLPCLPAV